MKDWAQMGIEMQTAMTLECFPALTGSQKSKILDEWSQNEYADDWTGHTKAQADLLTMCRYESLSVEQREQDAARLHNKGKH